MKNELNLKFTGKMSILIELEEFGPMEFRVNDYDVTLAVVKLILDNTDNITSVDSYNDTEGEQFKHILKKIP